MVATVNGAMLHVPPGNELLNAAVLPGHKGTLPVIGPGKPFTATVAVTVPQIVTYDTVAVPAAIAVTNPEKLIAATVDGVMLHVPPGNELVRRVVPPGQSGTLPVIGPGNPFTVTVAVTVPHVVT
jgi:hypothetical protein